jgi:hypothetical protein
MFSNLFPENCAVCKIMYKNMIEPQMTTWRMRFACWITKATNTRSEYVMLFFYGNDCYEKTPQCYAIRPVLSCLMRLTLRRLTCFTFILAV